MQDIPCLAVKPLATFTHTRAAMIGLMRELHSLRHLRGRGIFCNEVRDVDGVCAVRHEGKNSKLPWELAERARLLGWPRDPYEAEVRRIAPLPTIRNMIVRYGWTCSRCDKITPGDAFAYGVRCDFPHGFNRDRHLLAGLSRRGEASAIVLPFVCLPCSDAWPKYRLSKCWRDVDREIVELAFVRREYVRAIREAA